MDNYFTAEEIEKLPKWAQRKVKVLYNDYKTIKKTEVKIKCEKSRIYLNKLYEKIYLPEEPVSFTPTNQKVNNIEVRISNDGINLYGRTALYIKPVATNSVFIKSNNY